MKRRALIFVLAVAPHAHALGFIADGCGYGLEFLCSINSYVETASQLYDAIYGDIGELTQAFSQEANSLSFSTIANFLPWDEVNRRLGPLNATVERFGEDFTQAAQDIEDYRAEYRGAINDFRSVAFERFTSRRSPAGSISHGYEQMLRKDPALQVAEIDSINRSTRERLKTTETSTNYLTSKALAANLTASEAGAEALADVVSTSLIPGGQDGTAATLKDRVSKAPSSRVVWEAIGHGFSDFMSQEATFDFLQLEAFKTIAEQNALSNHQFKLTADQLIQEKIDEADNFRYAMESAYTAAYQEGQMTAEEVVRSLDMVSDLGEVDVADYKK